MIEQITDPKDPRIADYQEVRERDLVGRRGRFIAEGEVVLRALLGSSQARTVSLLVSDRQRVRLDPLISELPGETPVFAASQTVMDAIVGFPIHRGILAVGERPAPPDPSSLLAGVPEAGLILALSGISNHDNMGGLFRNAAAFGVSAVLLDAGCCDPLYRKALRVSVGAVLRVPFARLEPGGDLAACLEASGVRRLALSPSGDCALGDVRVGGRMAALFGAEGPGLSPELMARCETVRIPMAEGFDSLNVATTSGIVLHHLSTARQSQEPLS
jgi:tRNA G18 (ribose-2'-O)-methylase SpoU